MHFFFWIKYFHNFTEFDSTQLSIHSDGCKAQRIKSRCLLAKMSPNFLFPKCLTLLIQQGLNWNIFTKTLFISVPSSNWFLVSVPELRYKPKKFVELAHHFTKNIRCWLFHHTQLWSLTCWNTDDGSLPISPMWQGSISESRREPRDIYDFSGN